MSQLDIPKETAIYCLSWINEQNKRELSSLGMRFSIKYDSFSLTAIQKDFTKVRIITRIFYPMSEFMDRNQTCINNLNANPNNEVYRFVSNQNIDNKKALFELISVYILSGFERTLKDRFFDSKRNGRKLAEEMAKKDTEHFISRVYALQTLVSTISSIEYLQLYSSDVPKDFIKCFRFCRRYILFFLENFPI